MIGLSLFAYGIIFLEIPLITTFILCVDAKEMPLFLLNDRVKGERSSKDPGHVVSTEYWASYNTKGPTQGKKEKVARSNLARESSPLLNLHVIEQCLKLGFYLIYLFNY